MYRISVLTSLSPSAVRSHLAGPTETKLQMFPSNTVLQSFGPVLLTYGYNRLCIGGRPSLTPEAHVYAVSDSDYTV